MKTHTIKDIEKSGTTLCKISTCSDEIANGNIFKILIYRLDNKADE